MPEISGGGIPIPSPSPSEQEAASPGEILCEHVTLNALDGVWHLVEPMLKEAVNWSEKQTIQLAKLEGIDDIYLKLKGEKYALWLCLRDGQVLAAVVLGVTEHSRCLVVDIHYGAGLELKHWIGPFCETIVDKSRNAGCRFIRVNGRKGWAAALKKLGFTEAYVAFMREI